jgi:sensor c-di-GMP phosphodiesterase-like protein
MTESEFLSRVYLGLGIAAVVVLLVAILVIAIILVARSILNTATQALAIANEIVVKTQPIWELETTNAVAVELLEGAQAIEEHAGQIAAALEAPVASR